MSSKKKVGIVTLHHANNYGAVYQTYALSSYIEGLGFEVFIIDYVMDRATIYSYLKNPIVFLRKMLSKKAFTVSFLKEKRQYHQGKHREEGFLEKFNDFRKDFLNITKREYDYTELKKSCPKTDFLITGSDQVWAADFFFSSPAYLLGFCPKGVKRISYAPSFGKSRLEPYLHRIFKDKLLKFDAVSVRERSGVEIVKEVAGIDAIKVVDPTLLLKSYSNIVDYSLVPSSPYILTYRLNQEHGLACWMSDCIKKISIDKGLPVYRVSTNNSLGLEEIGEDLQPTPGQLLGLIEKSSMVLTNSFHGTVFSLLFRVRFLCFARDIFEDKQNLRMLELLDLVGLQDLFCQPFIDPCLIGKKTDCGIDWGDVHQKLGQARLESESFLRKALEIE